MDCFREKFRKAKDDDKNCLIHYLAKRCFHETIQTDKYVEKEDFNIPGYSGMAPIHFAARYGTDAEAIERTLSTLENYHQKDECKDEFGNTVLHHAILNSTTDSKAVEIAMKKGYKVEARNKRKMNALHVAVKEKSLVSMRLILAKTPEKRIENIIKDRNIDNEDCIMIGIKDKEKNIINTLLNEHSKFGFDENTKKEWMICCADFGDFDIMTYLYEVLEIQGNERLIFESLCSAIKSNQEEIVGCLIGKVIRDEEKNNLLELAMKSGHPDIFEFLVERFDLKEKQPFINFDFNFIRHAVTSGNIQMVEILYEFLSKNHSDLCTKMLKEQKFDDGSTPLHEACDTNSKLNSLEISKIVEIYGKGEIPLEVLKNDKKQTPLHLSAKCGRLEHAKALLRVKRNEILLNSEDDRGNRAVHTAAEYSKEEVFEFLLDKTNYKHLNSFGRSLLHVIAEFGSEKCFDILVKHVEKRISGDKLLKNEINIDSKDYQENTPLHLATQNGHQEIVRKLLKLEANVLETNEKGENAFEVAIESQQANIIQAFIESISWKESLRAGFVKDIGGKRKVLDTPMRKLIRKFPDIAEIVLNNCKEEKQKTLDQPRTTKYIFEFLEDTYKYRYEKESDHADASYIHVTKDKKEQRDSRGDFAKRYTDSGDMFFENHPLMTINNYKQQKLLMHDVTKNLINTKWDSFGYKFYYINLGFYCLFLTALTINVMTSIWPQEYPALYSCSSYFDDHKFTKPNQTYILPETVLHRATLNYASRASVWVFVAIRLVSVFIGHEMKIPFKVFRKLDMGMGRPTNLFYYFLKEEWGFFIDMTVYLLSAIIATAGFYDPTLEDGKKLETYLKPCWVWRISAGTITIAWINLLLYMRQMPIFGKYIIILNDIIYTFIKFVVIFIIFVISFTFGFHVLLNGGGGGGKFDHFQDAFLKTMTMMSGEFDYGDIFFPEDGSSPAPYPDLTYAFFMIFFILLALLLMNLLLGLTLNDVSILVEVASIKKMSMRLKFCLNLERMIWKWEYVERSHGKKWKCFRFPDDNDNLVTFVLVKMKIYKVARNVNCFRDLFDQVNNKIVDKMVREDNEVQLDPRSRMWKQVIRENVMEDKKNEIEELIVKTDKIEKIAVNKIQEIDDQMKEVDDRVKYSHTIIVKNLHKIDERAKKDHEKRKLELQKMMEGFEAFIDQRKVQENEERNTEINRTIHFMGTLGKT